MQQTLLDHFLKKKFVYQYEISCNRIPPELPAGIVLSTGLDNDHGKWGHLLQCENEDSYHSAIALLRSNRILFFPTINERDGVVGHVLNPQGTDDSFTWNSFWGGVRLGMTSVVGVVVPRVAPFALIEGIRNVLVTLRLL